MVGRTELSAEMVNMKFTHSAVQILAGRLMAGWRHDWFQFDEEERGEGRLRDE
jgi:hypothetical protein